MIPEIINDRYLVQSTLGESDKSIVLKTLDLHLNRNVALKLMKERATSQYIEDLIRFKKQIQIVTKFSHLNIMHIYGEDEFSSMPFIVMEYLEGEVLSNLLNDQAVFPMMEVVDIIKQTAEALHYVHNQGVIHRDIKPGNIFIIREKSAIQVKLLDFGIAWIIELDAIKEIREIAGTFGYMSPEATGMLERPIDERSDLYSLGVVFYHLLTGIAPFQGDDISRILHQQVALNPVKPHKINPAIPAVLEAIVMKLLNKDPDFRYQSARGLLCDLEKVMNGASDFEVGSQDQKIKVSYQTRLIGRNEEQKRIEALFDKASGGKGGFCLISGEAGSGKSRLVEEIKRYVYEKNGVFLRGRCLNYENKFPYQPFKDVIDEYINKTKIYDKRLLSFEKDRITEILGELSGLVFKLNPRLKNFLGEPKETVPLEPERENQRFLMTLASFFGNLVNNDRGYILFLDDLQWADESSFNLLEELLRGLENSNLLIIGTYRDNEIRPGHHMEHIIDVAETQSINFDRIQLQPFQLEDMTELIRYILGGDVADIDSLSGLVVNKSNGNPFFAINMIRELVEKNMIFWEKGHWRQDSRKMAEIPISNSLLDIILRRIENLTEPQKELLIKGAVIGREFEIELLYRLTALTQTEVVHMIDDFIGLQLLERSTQNGWIIFVHDRIRDAFYHTVSEEDRKKIHLKIALVIEEIHQDNPEKVIYELAHHFWESGETVKTLQYVIPAAIKAKNSYANEEAIRFFKIGLDLLESQGRKNVNDWLVASEELAKVYLTIGEYDHTIQINQNMLVLVTDRIAKARLYRTIGTAYFKKGDWNNCESHFHKGLEVLGERILKNNLKILVSVLKEVIVYEGYELFLKYLPWKKEITAMDETKKGVFWIYHDLGWMYMLNDTSKVICNVTRIMNISNASLAKTKESACGITAYAVLCMPIPLFKKSIQNHQKALNLRGEVNDKWGEAQSLQFLGFTYQFQGNHKAAIHNFKLSLRLFQKMGDIWETKMIYNGLGLEYYFIGHYDKALDYFSQYLDLSRKSNDKYGCTCSLLNTARCHIEKGDYEIAKGILIKEEGQSKDIQFLYCLIKMLLGRIEFDAQNYQNAFELLVAAKKIDGANVFLKHYTSQIYPYLAEAYLFLIKTSYQNLAIPHHEKQKIKQYCLEAWLQTKLWPHYHGVSLLILAKYYWTTGKHQRAQKYFLKSIKHNQKIGRPFELGRSCYEYAIFQSERNPQESKATFQKAYEIFKEVNAGFYIQKCASFLGGEVSDNPEEGSRELSARNRLKSSQRMETILATSNCISSILDLDQLLEKIMDSAIEIVGAERGALFLYSEDSTIKLELKVRRNISPVELDQEFSTSYSIVSRVSAAQEPIIIADALSENEFKMQSSVVLHGIRSVLAAPIKLHGKMIGILYLDNNLVSGLFKDEDLKIIDLLMNQAGVSIENARLYQRLKEYSKEIEESRNKIAEWNQELEQRVLERTLELNVKSNELAVMNQELSGLNRRLEKYAATVEELAVVKERNRVAKEIHDTLGHTLTMLIMLMKIGKIKCDQNPAETKEKLSEAIEIAQDNLVGLRSSIMGLLPESFENGNMIMALEKLFQSVTNSGLQIDFLVHGEDIYRKIYHLNITIKLSEAIYKICQEAITNSIRHGNASKVTIVLQFSMELVKLFIVDDGQGCKKIKKGFGLSGMEERVKAFQGTIAYGCGGGKGFNIHVEIPIGRCIPS
jgi:signal transduction histidine kinase/serine/threonine protein kinase/Tfp pilus assembly protein PilF